MDPKQKKLHISLFVLYAGLMLWLLFHRSDNLEGVPYWEQIRMSLNLIPLHTIRKYLHLLDSSRPYLVRLAVVNLVGNVIMFIPLGFFLPAVFQKLYRLWKTLLTTALAITLIELAQLFTLLGSCDVDDLILNLLGAAIGYGIFKLLNK